MAVPWKTIGRYALLFAEYALERRLAPQPPAPAPAAPSAPTPEPSAPPAPPVKILRDYYDDVDRIYREELGRTTDSGNELYEAAVLLRDGKEAELRVNLRNRR